MSSLSSGLTDHSRSFADPDQYQAAIRGGDSLYALLGRGTFHAELTDIEVGGLKLQRGRESLPRLAASGIPSNKVGVVLWAKDRRLPVVRGVQIRPGEILCLGPGVQSHHRTSGPNEFTALIMNSSDLLRVANELTGDEFTVANGTVLRPPDHLLTRLLSLIEFRYPCEQNDTRGICLAARHQIVGTGAAAADDRMPPGQGGPQGSQFQSPPCGLGEALRGGR